MQPATLTGRQQQLGLLMGRAQPDVLDAARVAALLNGQPNTLNLQSGLGGAGIGTGGLAGLGGTSAGLNLNLGNLPTTSQSAIQPGQLGLPDQLALLSQFPHALFPQYGSADRDLQLGGLRNVGKTRSVDSRSSSAYASRHQAAEQRRRTRINERLELLRKLVPHAERANTACFLEEVIKYIEALKRRTLELESALESATGKPVTKSLVLPSGASGVLPAGLDAGHDSPTPSPRHPSNSAAQAQNLGSSAAQGSGIAVPASPLNLPKSSSLHAPSKQSQQLSQQQQGASERLDQLPPPLPATATQSQQLSQLQLAHLLPSVASAQQPLTSAQQLAAQHHQQLLFQHSGALSLNSTAGGGGNGGSLSLGHNMGSVALAHFTGLQAQQQQHGNGGLLHPSSALSSHHLSAQQLSDLQTLQAMHSLHQSSRVSHHSLAGAFHPAANKAAFLHFNEDFFGGIKPELLPARSLLGAAASTTPSNSLQLTSAHLPADSGTMVQQPDALPARKTQSGSPVSSEESGVPLKKRKVLVL